MYYVDTGLYELPTLMTVRYRPLNYVEFCLLWAWKREKERKNEQ
ncbi:MAG: hypothetical protein Q4B88_07085 [Moraxella sp.]|nr:hypothetical protein [Moraxella sp.]